jgi:hypothetical protein
VPENAPVYMNMGIFGTLMFTANISLCVHIRHYRKSTKSVHSVFLFHILTALQEPFNASLHMLNYQTLNGYISVLTN